MVRSISMEEWKPSPSGLQQILELLHMSGSPNTETQRTVQNQLDELNTHPEFVCYLIYIMSRLKNEQVTSRSVAGLILKNCVRKIWNQLPEQIHSFIKNEALSAISDPNPLIKATAGVITTTILLHEGVSKWPMLIPTLCEMCRSSDIDMQMGALSGLQKIYEDSTDVLNNGANLEILIPVLFSFLDSPLANLRSMSISTLNSIMMVHLPILKDAVDVYVSHLFRLSADEDMEVQKQLCRALTLVLDVYFDKLYPQLGNITEFMLLKTQDSNHATALEACEFWLTFADSQDVCRQTLQPILPRLIPVLIRCMQYSVADLILLKADVEDDSAIPDKPQDIRPRFHHSKSCIETNPESTDDEDDVGDDSSMDWNLSNLTSRMLLPFQLSRKCSAASLDVLSSVFGEEFFPVLWPILKETLMSEDWLVKESGILALGAVAEGCMNGIKQFLPHLIPFLIDALSDRKALVRSIACWTLSRYCQFVVQQDHNLYFKRLLKSLLVSILDRSKRVQEAACSAFATFEEEATKDLVPYLTDIVSTLAAAFQHYQAKNLLILYDAVGTLADSVGSYLVNPAYLEALMTPLMAKLNHIGGEDRELFPLLECMSSVASALQSTFLPFLKPVFDRCVSIISRIMYQVILAKEKSADAGLPDKDFLVIALDVLSTLAEVLGEQVDHSVGESDLLSYLYECAMDLLPEVRQSAFALLGDLIKISFHRLQPHLEMIVSLLIQNITPEHVSVCNNAIWAMGELALKSGDAIKGHVQTVLPSLIIVMCRDKIPKTLMENTAITIGRIGLTLFNDIAPYLPYFLRPWCVALRNVRDNPEKESAFMGLCCMIHANPGGIVEDFIFFCDAIASWSNPPAHLKAMFEEILRSFRDRIGFENWATFTSQFPPLLQQRLIYLYSI